MCRSLFIPDFLQLLQDRSELGSLDPSQLLRSDQSQLIKLPLKLGEGGDVGEESGYLLTENAINKDLFKGF